MGDSLERESFFSVPPLGLNVVSLSFIISFFFYEAEIESFLLMSFPLVSPFPFFPG
jgi:hypothetical protein